MRLDNQSDIYGFAHHLHETQPCTPLLNKGRGSTIYGQVGRCTCPHTITPLYARKGVETDGVAEDVNIDNASAGQISAASRSGSHYFVLDPDVIADQRPIKSIPLKTFGRGVTKNPDGSESYPMCTIKSYKRPAPDRPDHVANGAASGSMVQCSPTIMIQNPHVKDSSQNIRLEDVDNNENEIRHNGDVHAL